jgi:hypothetical protein
VKQPKRSLRLDAIDSMIPTQENFQLDFTERVRSAVQATIQVILDEELERLVGAGPYERSDQRVDVRNGRYDRHVVTTAPCARVVVASRWRPDSRRDRGRGAERRS